MSLQKAISSSVASPGLFMRQMQRAIDSRIGSSNNSSDFDLNGTSPSGRYVTKDSLSGKRIVEYVLPPRKTADKLADAYKELVDLLYPLLDRRSFETAYESV